MNNEKEKVEDSLKSGVETGDKTNLSIYAWLFMLSALSITISALRKKKVSKQSS